MCAFFCSSSRASIQSFSCLQLLFFVLFACQTTANDKYIVRRMDESTFRCTSHSFFYPSFSLSRVGLPVYLALDVIICVCAVLASLCASPGMVSPHTALGVQALMLVMRYYDKVEVRGTAWRMCIRHYSLMKHQLSQAEFNNALKPAVMLIIGFSSPFLPVSHVACLTPSELRCRSCLVVRLTARQVDALVKQGDVLRRVLDPMDPDIKDDVRETLTRGRMAQARRADEKTSVNALFLQVEQLYSAGRHLTLAQSLFPGAGQELCATIQNWLAVTPPFLPS